MIRIEYANDRGIGHEHKCDICEWSIIQGEMFVDTWNEFNHSYRHYHKCCYLQKRRHMPENWRKRLERDD